MIDVRERLTERLNRARLALEVRRATIPLFIVAVGALVGLIAWGVQVIGIGKHALTDSQEVRFAVDDATAVKPGRQEVRFKGIPAGRITELETVDGEPVITAQFLDEFGPIYRDARAELRPNTALEDMYVDVVDRGSKKAGLASADTPIPASQTHTAVQVEEVLQVFDPEVRGHMAALLRELGGGLEDRGDELRAIFVKVVPFLQVAVRMTDQLGERSEATRRLVSRFSTLTEELARRDDELRSLLSEGGATLRAIGDSSGDLDSTLRELPPTLAGADSSLVALRGVLPDVDQALESLRPVADRLPEGLSSLSSLSDSAAPAVSALREPVTRLVPLAQELRPFSSRLGEALARLRPEVPTFDHVTESAVPCIYPALYGFMHWTASLTKFEDARMEFPRGDASVSISSNPTVRDPNTTPAPGCAPGMPRVGGF